MDQLANIYAANLSPYVTPMWQVSVKRDEVTHGFPTLGICRRNKLSQ